MRCYGLLNESSNLLYIYVYLGGTTKNMLCVCDSSSFILLAKISGHCNMTIIYYTISDDSGSMTEFCVGIAATARPLKPAAWRPWQRALAVSPVTPKQSVSVARWPPCRPRLAPHCDKVGSTVPVRTWWHGRGPTVTVELTNLDGAFSDREEWCA